MNRQREKLFPTFRPFPERAEAWNKISGHRKTAVVKNTPFAVTDIFIRTATPGAEGKKIAFFSDLHWNNDKKSENLFSHLLRSLEKEKPDSLLIGGDLTGSAEFIPQLKKILPELSKRVPHTFAIHGNWEEGKSWLNSGFWNDFYADCGIKLLLNDYVVCQPFLFAGVRDISSGRQELPELPDDKLCRILIAHSPDTLISLDRDRHLSPYAAALCGHTHGGQISLPLFGAIFIPGRYGKKFASGIFKRKNSGTTLIVSRGINELSFPWRFNCPREMIMLHFTKENGL